MTDDIANHYPFYDPCPMPLSTLYHLLQYIESKDLLQFDGHRVSSVCDHTHRYTREFLSTQTLDAERIVPWLQMHGGCCDCEVVLNVG
jgi:hypothetical protein